jgi:hypothetical protein
LAFFRLKYPLGVHLPFESIHEGLTPGHGVSLALSMEGIRTDPGPEYSLVRAHLGSLTDRLQELVKVLQFEDHLLPGVVPA